MTAALQGSNEIVIGTEPERIWAILEDSTLLPRWAPMVKQTTGKTETVGSVRTCQVEWNGRKDEVVERCVEAIPNKRIGWVMERGMMTKLFSNVSFWFSLEPKDRAETLLRMGFHYEPKHVIARLMYHLMMKRKMDQLRKTLLDNIKKLAEEPTAPSARART